MKTIRAVIFDVYKTLLQVDPPEADSSARWKRIYHDYFHISPPVSYSQFVQETRDAIARDHALAREKGITFPEVHWKSVINTVLPQAACLEPPRHAQFTKALAGLTHRVSLMPGAGEFLHWCKARAGLELGIASNAQPYSILELEEALATENLTLQIFHPSWRCWSFQLGFSKPDRHFFRVLDTRLKLEGLLPSEILMVGDRIDNDIEPASDFGWQTWHFHLPGKGFPELGKWLAAKI